MVSTHHRPVSRRRFFDAANLRFLRLVGSPVAARPDRVVISTLTWQSEVLPRPSPGSLWLLTPHLRSSLIGQLLTPHDLTTPLSHHGKQLSCKLTSSSTLTRPCEGFISRLNSTSASLLDSTSSYQLQLYLQPLPLLLPTQPVHLAASPPQLTLYIMFLLQ